MFTIIRQKSGSSHDVRFKTNLNTCLVIIHAVRFKTLTSLVMVTCSGGRVEIRLLCKNQNQNNLCDVWMRIIAFGCPETPDSAASPVCPLCTCSWAWAKCHPVLDEKLFWQLSEPECVSVSCLSKWIVVSSPTLPSEQILPCQARSSVFHPASGELKSREEPNAVRGEGKKTRPSVPCLCLVYSRGPDAVFLTEMSWVWVKLFNFL